MLSGGLAGGGAGCGNGSIGNFGVTGCGDNGSVFCYFISAAFVREILSAACAVNIIDVSVLSTGGCMYRVDFFRMSESRTNRFGGCFAARAFKNELTVCSTGCGDIGNDFGVVMSESNGTVRFGLGSAAAVSHAGKCVVTGFGTGSCMIYGSTPAVTESLFFNGRSEVTIRALFLCYAGGFALCGNGTVIDEIMCNIVVNGIDDQVGGDVRECFIPTCKLLMRRSIEFFGMRGSGGS